MTHPTNITIRLGAVSYILWGALHVWVAWSIWQLGMDQDAGWVRGRLLQDAAFMLFFAIGAIVAAIVLLSRRSRRAYWWNAILVTFADIVWIALFIVPGLAGGVRAWAGPVLWLLGLALTTHGMFMHRPKADAASSLS